MRFLFIAVLAASAVLAAGGQPQAAGERPPRISAKDVPPSNAAELAAEESAEKRFQQVADQAHAAMKKTREAGGDWRGASRLLMQAAAAAQAEDFDEAIGLAQRARAEAEAGYRAATARKQGLPQTKGAAAP